MPAAVEHVRRFRRLRALVIGDAMLDSYLEGTAARLCTEGPVPVVRKTAEERAPGGAANTAANLRALGAGVTFLGIVGPDPAGAQLRALLRQRGIDDRWLVEDAGVSTLHKLRILADGQYVVRFDEGDTEHCSGDGHARLLAHFDAAFHHCDLVVISDYGYGAVYDRLLDRLRALRAARPCVLAIDSKQLHRFHQAGATIVTPNYREACLTVDPFSRHDDGTQPDVRQLGRRLLEMIETEYVVITMGGDGAALFARDGSAMQIPAHAVAHVHDVGAGDSFTAAIALALAAGAHRVDAVRIGIDAAGVAVTKRRTAVTYYQELLQRVSLAEQAGHRAAGPRAVAALASRLDAERLAGRTIVFTNGVFDILHAGHVRFLRQARDLGDILVVGVNSDRSARRLKGEGRPINRERDRVALVAALDAVDHAILFDESNPAALIRKLRPHIHVKGGDYDGERLPEAEAVEAVGGRVVILPLTGSLSTSRVIDRIRTLAFDGAIGAGP